MSEKNSCVHTKDSKDLLFLHGYLSTYKTFIYQIKYFDANKLNSLIIQDILFDINKYMNVFEECINLESVIVPDDCSYFKRELFKNGHFS